MLATTGHGRRASDPEGLLSTHYCSLVAESPKLKTNKTPCHVAVEIAEVYHHAASASASRAPAGLCVERGGAARRGGTLGGRLAPQAWRAFGRCDRIATSQPPDWPCVRSLAKPFHPTVTPSIELSHLPSNRAPFH